MPSDTGVELVSWKGLTAAWERLFFQDRGVQARRAAGAVQAPLKCVGLTFGVFDMKRFPVNKRKSVRKFNKSAAKTKAANLGMPMRGGIRL